MSSHTVGNTTGHSPGGTSSRDAGSPIFISGMEVAAELQCAAMPENSFGLAVVNHDIPVRAITAGGSAQSGDLGVHILPGDADAGDSQNMELRHLHQVMRGRYRIAIVLL